ncbi:hypothetical protein QE152_g29419 [Popillia japonica]|uniref:Uncharacterized protein n=1 Tax=Popillia japonica TaxID=7064 RepID=A0AAW1JIT4_POPJA
MGVVHFTHIALLLFFILTSCLGSTLRKRCESYSCKRFKPNTMWCRYIGYVQDPFTNEYPFTNECVTKCDDSCVNGKCNFCYCYYTDRDVSDKKTKLSECNRIVADTHTHESGGVRYLYNFNSCNNTNYIVNPSHPAECLLRCDQNSCGNGDCQPSGYCYCHFGYHPDVANPRVCVKNPQNNQTNLAKTCHKGFKLNPSGECVSICGDCKNGGCDTNGVCRCWENYTMDATTSTCILKNDTEYRTKVFNKLIPSTLNIERSTEDNHFKMNDGIIPVGDYTRTDSSSVEDQAITSSTDRIIIISIVVNSILLISTIALVFFLLKIRRNLLRTQSTIRYQAQSF